MLDLVAKPLLRAAQPLAAPLLATVLAVTLTACGSDDADGGTDTSTEVSATEHNDADVAFATEMIQHHAQALAMVDLTLGRDLDPEVAQLTEDIRAAQAPEIELMVDWLTDWDEEVPETVRDHANAHGDGGDDEDMDALEGASDAEFQDTWLTMMIEHHEGAIEMAGEEADDGRFQPVVELAEAIVAAQTAEIETMESLLS